MHVLAENGADARIRLGPYEFQIFGSLRDWEGWSTAHNINVETLLTNGKHDQTQDVSFEGWFKAIPKVKWVTFESSSHTAQYEERERYMQIVGDFLKN
jgi:L-proline amide hydrolase